MIVSSLLALALLAPPQKASVSASAHPGSGSMTAPPNGAQTRPTMQVFSIHIGGFGKGTQTGFWEEAVIYAPPTTKPRPMLVIFHRYGVSQWDGLLSTRFYEWASRRGWYVVHQLAPIF